MAAIWRVELLGTLQAKGEHGVVSRFRTRKVGLLLAYLAYYSERTHSREELADMLWPEAEPELARRNLRQALSSLRRHLEPPAVPAGAVLLAKQALVSLNAEYVETDVADLARLHKEASTAATNSEKIKKLTQAVEMYRGDLLPGYYEDWIQRERLQLEDLFVSSLRSLIEICEQEGRVDEAIRYVRLALSKDYLQEDLHASLMRLYLASDRPASAVQHFEEWKKALASELGDEPGPETLALARMAGRTGAVREERKAPKAKQVRPIKKAAEETISATVQLPIQLTRFFGRIQDRDRCIEAFAKGRTRLLTLLGPAGTGKTRLSVESGRQLAEAHGLNVWFVPLADLHEGSMVLDAMLSALKLNKQAGGTPLEVIQANLPDGKNLLILDNLEHILETALPDVERLLKEVPEISLLVTSRHALKLEGEHVIDLETLPLPSDDLLERDSLSDLAEVPSVQLFVDRAQAVLPDFQITANNSRAIVALCRKLDGLPLALEIAAGLSNAFTPAQLVQNLDARLEVLRSRRRDLTPRHRSLRAAIDYSYDLLPPALQRFFVSLSVFRGGFTVEAASDICLPEGKASKRKLESCLRTILDLQERSLLHSHEAAEGSPARFRLLESFREYGAAMLDEESEGALRQRHAHYFLNQLDGDRENRLAAMRFFLEAKMVHECILMLRSLRTFSYTGRDILLALARLPENENADVIDRTALLGMLSKAHRYASENEEAHQACLKALDISKDAGRDDLVAMFQQELAVTYAGLGRIEEAIAQSEGHLRYALEKEDWNSISIAYMNIGTNQWSLGNLEEALAALESAMDASMKRPEGQRDWVLHYNLARVHLDMSDLDEGMQMSSEGLRIAQGMGDEFGISMCLALISRYHRLKGNQAAALATSHEALTRRRKVGFVYWTFQAIHAHGLVLLEMGCYPEATTLFAASRSISKMNREVDDREYADALQKVRDNLSESGFEQAWATGLAMSVDEAFKMAASFR